MVKPSRSVKDSISMAQRVARPVTVRKFSSTSRYVFSELVSRNTPHRTSIMNASLYPFCPTISRSMLKASETWDSRLRRLPPPTECSPFISCQQNAPLRSYADRHIEDDWKLSFSRLNDIRFAPKYGSTLSNGAIFGIIYHLDIDILMLGGVVDVVQDHAARCFGLRRTLLSRGLLVDSR